VVAPPGRSRCIRLAVRAHGVACRQSAGRQMPKPPRCPSHAAWWRVPPRSKPLFNPYRRSFAARRSTGQIDPWATGVGGCGSLQQRPHRVHGMTVAQGPSKLVRAHQRAGESRRAAEVARRATRAAHAAGSAKVRLGNRHVALGGVPGGAWAWPILATHQTHPPSPDPVCTCSVELCVTSLGNSRDCVCTIACGGPLG
jgi:hypothetical protein